MIINQRYRTVVEGIDFPALAGKQGASLLAVLGQLDESQWWAVEQLRSAQQEQLLTLLNHARQTVPFYKQLLSEVGFQTRQAWDEQMWSELPVLKRQQVQELGDRLHSQRLPGAHGKAFHIQSSGSTGRPVQALGTSITQFFWNVVTLRDNHWQQHDFMKKFAAIRPDRGAKGHERVHCNSWGTPVDWIYHSVPTMVINSRVDVNQQLLWLKEYQPVYLLSLPSNLRELLRLCEHKGVEFPDLQQVRCFGETVTPQLRAHVHRVLGVGVSDIYSSQEVGYIALQCPDYEHYHVQSETMYVEILDDKDQPCAPGEIGRVVVTSLHNFAMPLIRYEVGDYAEVGEPCPCGRGLPVLKQIMGRSRNMVRTPEGKCYWPSFPVDDLLKVAKVRQFQLQQTSLDTIEVFLVLDEDLTGQQEKQLKQKLHTSLNYPFNIKFNRVDVIAVQKNGKYEDFVSFL